MRSCVTAMPLAWIAVAPWPGLPNATLSNSRFGRNTRYQRRRPRTADQRHHGWYVLAPLRPVGHGRCANGGQPRRRFSDSGNQRSAFQGQLRRCLDRRLGARRVPGLHVATRRRRDAAAGRGGLRRNLRAATGRDGNRVHGLDERRMGISEGNLRAIPAVIAVTTGPEKIPATRAVLRSGLLSSLVTDTEVAGAV